MGPVLHDVTDEKLVVDLCFTHSNMREEQRKIPMMPTHDVDEAATCQAGGAIAAATQW